MSQRIAVIGAGRMARVRAHALLATGQATICGVASRTLESAQRFGQEIGCQACYDRYERLLDASADAVLIEIPHQPQDAATFWALEHDLHVLVGGCLASTSQAAQRIADMARSKALVVEAGYASRYGALWRRVQEMHQRGELGRLIAVRSIALWAGDPSTWYYSQALSGGMPLTHMTYGYINLLRWVLGDPLCVSAVANRVRHTAPDLVEQETCLANLVFADDVIASMMASFCQPGDLEGWSVLFLGTEGLAKVDSDRSLLEIDRDGERIVLDYSASADPFVLQAQAFCAALNGQDTCLNTPTDCLGDVRVAEAIARSCQSHETIWL